MSTGASIDLERSAAIKEGLAFSSYTPHKPRFPGIVADAKTLGVTRLHLYFVLKGDRVSPGLLRRYQALKKRQNGGEAA